MIGRGLDKVGTTGGATTPAEGVRQRYSDLGEFER